MARRRQEMEERGEDPSTSAAAVWHGSEAEATEVVVYHTAILRNKRLLMAYTYVLFYCMFTCCTVSHISRCPPLSSNTTTENDVWICCKTSVGRTATSPNT